MPSQSLDTIGRVEFYVVVFFFPARAYICAIIVIREYKKKNGNMSSME